MIGTFPMAGHVFVVKGDLTHLACDKLGHAVADLLRGYRHHSLSHALLAALPVEAVVTTNYDLLFEAASAAAGFPVRVLPERPRPGDRRWLLKMHGSVDQPDEIVLTSEDDLRYEERWAALAGIVQALLITRHMLFVGFGLRDENFHRIADEVRKAIRARADGADDRFGTALVRLENRLQAELWEDDLHWVATGGPDDDEVEAARRLEIVLDCVLAETSSASYLLHPAYERLLSDAERALATALRRFADDLPADARNAGVWERVARLLSSLGGDDLVRESERRPAHPRARATRVAGRLGAVHERRASAMAAGGVPAGARRGRGSGA